VGTALLAAGLAMTGALAAPAVQAAQIPGRRAQNIQIRNGARLDRTRHQVDQIGGSARGYPADLALLATQSSPIALHVYAARPSG
jgi:hypothetical protein